MQDGLSNEIDETIDLLRCNPNRPSLSSRLLRRKDALCRPVLTNIGGGPAPVGLELFEHVW
jgi:hypothetical protein